MVLNLNRLLVVCFMMLISIPAFAQQKQHKIISIWRVDGVDKRYTVGHANQDSWKDYKKEQIKSAKSLLGERAEVKFNQINPGKCGMLYSLDAPEGRRFYGWFAYPSRAKMEKEESQKLSSPNFQKDGIRIEGKWCN